MRNYQTLTLIGSALSMIIAVGFYLFATGLSSMTESFNESGFVESDTLAQSRSTMAYVYVSVPLVIILEIVALVLVFVATKRQQVKIIGVLLIITSVVVLIATSWYGILPFALLLPAGIIAVRYKQKESEDSTVYHANGSPVKMMHHR